MTIETQPEIKDLRPWSCPVCRDDLTQKTSARATEKSYLEGSATITVIVATYSCASCGYWFEQPHALNGRFKFASTL